MVSVAKSFDAPIKLLFPTSDPSRPFSMLGLGDIVIPVLNVSWSMTLIIFDVLYDWEWKSQNIAIGFTDNSCLNLKNLSLSGNANNFLLYQLISLAMFQEFLSRGKQYRYFNSAFAGYTLGLILMIVVMNWFNAAQPALLYIVPGVVGFVAVHSLWNGEVKPQLEYDEAKEANDDSASSSASQDSDAKLSNKVE
ncbi:signal peptide peptidase 1-like [Typha angustifolia]|uniref:signal peptide peptidase 1-like n=1 Tax=Typha angustifolia TaxID=59011 RepID=UPI003C2B55AF